MFNRSVDQGATLVNPEHAPSIRNYLREFQAEEARAARSQDPIYLQDLRKLRARRPQLIAQLATNGR